MTARKLNRRPCAPGRRSAVGVVCLIVGLCCTGCGKDEPEPPAKVPSGASAGAARSAAKPAARMPPAVVAGKPAPAAAARPAPAVAEKPAPAAVDTPAPAVTEKPAPPAAVETASEPVVERPEPAVAATESSETQTQRMIRQQQAPAEETVVAPDHPEPADQAPVEAPAREMVADLPVARQPQTVADHVALAEAAAQNGDCEQALHHFSLARRLSPDNLDVRRRESETCRHCGQPQKALELLGRMDLRVRVLESFTHEIAEAHLMLDQPGQAAMAWELRYMQYPDAWMAAVEAAQAWLLAGHEAPAQWWFEQARSAAPDTPEVEALETVFRSAALTD